MPPRPNYVSKQSAVHNEWYVVDTRTGHVVASGFDTWTEAEEWIKANEPEGRTPDTKRKR